MQAIMPDGSVYRLTRLLGRDGDNVKLAKAKKMGWMNIGLSFAPAKTSGYQMCPASTAGCRASCIYYAGMGRFKNVQLGRIARTRFYKQNPTAFIQQLERELGNASKLATKKGLKLAVRLNVLSDEIWEKKYPHLMLDNPTTQFYSYTKLKPMMNAYLDGKLPSNSYFTFSRSERNENDCVDFLRRGGNVAIPFRGGLPDSWNGFTVLDGDKSDLRHLDPAGSVIGLLVKGEGKKDKSGFVVDRISLL